MGKSGAWRVVNSVSWPNPPATACLSPADGYSANTFTAANIVRPSIRGFVRSDERWPAWTAAAGLRTVVSTPDFGCNLCADKVFVVYT